MPNAVIYCRVSTEEQAERGFSLDAQERFCRSFAKSNGYRPVAVYRDEGRSGTTLDRPSLKEMLSRIQERKSVDAVIVQETDRLARNTKDHLTVRALLRKENVKLISVAQPMLDDSPEGNMIDTIIASVNQFQSDINGRKTKKGLQERFDSGWWPGWAPLGYINKETKAGERVVLPDPERFDLVRKGLKLYLTSSYSASEIADLLHEEGLRSKTGKRVCESIMTNTLRNPFYTGIMKWNGQRKAGRHEPMITLAEHKQILEVLDTHNLHASRTRKHHFLLAGFAFCNICGGRYTAEKHPAKRIAYYHCDFHGKRGMAKPHGNEGQNVEVGDLERQVEERFRQIQFSQEFVDLVVQKARKLYDEQRKAIDGEKRVIFNQKISIERRRDVLEQKLLNGVITDGDFGRLKGKIDEELDRIHEQVEEKDLQRTYDVEVIRELLSLARGIHRAYKKAPHELKRRFLGLFWERFLVQDRRIVKAIPTRLIRELVQCKQVMVSSDWLPSPTLVITLRDYRYMASLREQLAQVKQLIASSSDIPSSQATT